MNIRMTLFAFVAALALASSAPAAPAPPAPTKEDRDNYERLIVIIYTGKSKENIQTAKETLVGMGEVGIVLLKEDYTKDVEGKRGVLAWTLLKELLPTERVEELRAFARKSLLDAARHWNRTYASADKNDAAVRARLKTLVGDYVDLLIPSDDPGDFTLLLKALQFSLIIGDKGADFGGEFDVWQKIWTLLNSRINEGATLQQLLDWRKIIDGHFRAYSQQKAYAPTKAIQAYHTTDLLMMQKINEVK